MLLRGIAALQGAGFAALALVPVVAFVALMDPNDPMRGTRSPDPLPLPDARAGGLAALPDRGEELNFHRLDFRAPDEDRSDGIPGRYFDHAPAAIKALDGRTVSIRGFMIPVEMEGGVLRRCVIVPSRMNCCFGQTPRFCEFIVARMTGAGVPVMLDEPLAFVGILRVGDVSEQGAWSAFYTLECSAVER